jgi:pyrroloquinoline-quinone synthase
MTPDALEAALQAIGAERYHIHHPFNHLLHGGKLAKGQVQAWALNRYYYQASIPAKDASLLARLPTPELRREWRRQLEDHDGDGVHPGGVERWLALTDGLGLDRDYVCLAERAAAGDALRGGRLCALRAGAVAAGGDRRLADGDVLAQHHLPARVGDAAQLRLRHRGDAGLFKPRLTQAPQDVAFALEYVKRHADTAEKQEAVLAALRFKCNLLRAQLDALHFAYVAPGLPPPGAFIPEGHAR